MKTNLLFVLLFISYLTHAQVEINASSVNAELEINSQTKGMRLPRIVKPEIVNQPNEGLVIYDQASQAPAFHNGTNWNLMASTPLFNPTDSLTYNLSFTPPGEELSLESISIGGSGGEAYVIFNISKALDKNTIDFYHSFLLNNFFVAPSAKVNMGPTNLLINVYKKGAISPYFSYKFTNFKILAYSSGASIKNSDIPENYTLISKIIGWKNWLTGDTIAFDFDSKIFTTY